MALYDASGNQLTVAQLRQILSQYSSGDENVTRVFDANGDAISGRSGLAGREAINNELASMGWSEGGGDYRGSNGEYYIPLDDPNKVTQAQGLDALQYINGIPVANFNDQSLRGGIGSGALFADTPNGTSGLGEFLPNLALVAGPAAAAYAMAPAAISNPFTGVGAGTYGATNSVIGSGLGGGSMGFFDDILSDNFDLMGNVDSISQSLTPEQEWAKSWGGLNQDGSINWDTFSQNDPFGMGSIDSGPVVPESSIFDNIGVKDVLSGGQSILKSLFGGSGLTNSSGGLFGDRGLLGTSLALAPGIAAINYARNQDPFDTSKLESAYNSVSPSGLTGQYDLLTAQGRDALTGSLQQRNVLGSSFGDQAITNYNTNRDIGRNSILTSGASTQANIASQILNAQIAQQKNKNDLYGRALLALSGGLSPSKQAIF